jgi:hypothetical protein
VGSKWITPFAFSVLANQFFGNLVSVVNAIRGNPFFDSPSTT